MLKTIGDKKFVIFFSAVFLLTWPRICTAQEKITVRSRPVAPLAKAAPTIKPAAGASSLLSAYADAGLPGSAFSGVVPAPNGRLYGLTYDGGTSNQGTLYSVDAALMAVTVHVNFNGTNGAVPYDELTYDTASAKFYGAASRGGTGNLGTIFSFDPVTNDLTTLKSDFDASIYEPRGPFVVSGGFIYGIIGRPYGGVFRMATDGSGYTVIHNFTTFSSLPNGVTLGADGKLYGVTLSGGIVCHQNYTSGCGTVFRLRPVLPGDTDTQFQTLYQMQTQADAGPQRTVVYGSDGLIYFNNHRRIFRLNPNNPAATFQMIWDEPGGSNSMSIIEGADNRLYAASYDNSQSLFAGSIFSLNHDGTDRVVLRTFSFTTGSTSYGPYGRLYRTNAGIVYGTTEYTNAGTFHGVVFTLSDSPPPKLKISGGDILVGSPGQGIILKSDNGLTCRLLSLDNTGALALTPVTCP